MKNVTVNKGQKLYVLASNGGYSCLGFDVCYKRAHALNKELHGLNGLLQGIAGPILSKPGTLKLYKQYNFLISEARELNSKTGWKSKSELIPEFIDREGWRVEVKTAYDTVERYIIGKSTGFIPCHLEIKKRGSSGGAAVCGYPFKSVNFIERVY